MGEKYYNDAEDTAWRVWIGFVLPRIGTGGGHLWHGRERSDFIQPRVFADQLSDYKLFNRVLHLSILLPFFLNLCIRMLYVYQQMHLFISLRKY